MRVQIGIAVAQPAPMKLVAKGFIGFLFLNCLFAALPSHALTMEELRKIPALTPEKFGRLFAGFEFKFHEEVQGHDAFLISKSGDCDDYATVAAEILEQRGYTPRMIAVRMKGETHVICYIKETKSYLDYNCRKDSNPMVPCDERITEIAKKVSASFGRDWIATYEFTFSDNTKRLVNNIVSNRAAENSVALTSAAAHVGAKKTASPKTRN